MDQRAAFACVVYNVEVRTMLPMEETTPMSTLVSPPSRLSPDSIRPSDLSAGTGTGGESRITLHRIPGNFTTSCRTRLMSTSTYASLSTERISRS